MEVTGSWKELFSGELHNIYFAKHDLGEWDKKYVPNFNWKIWQEKNCFET
jgi:hypothetical protein